MCGGGINIQAIRSHQPFVCMSPIERVLYVFQIIIAPCLHAAAFCCPWYINITIYNTRARKSVFITAGSNYYIKSSLTLHYPSDFCSIATADVELSLLEMNRVHQTKALKWLKLSKSRRQMSINHYRTSLYLKSI
jgi:hypothetical protein